MGDKLKIDGVLDGPADLSVFAIDWWQGDDGRLLPGEASGFTVFVVEFQDGCRYVSCTGLSVFVVLTELMCGSPVHGSGDFVKEHCREMAYVVRCVASDLAEAAAVELVDRLVLAAPERLLRLLGSRGQVLEDAECFLGKNAPGLVTMSFAEWAKTREKRGGPSRQGR